MADPHFRGELLLKWLEDGRLMQLQSEFAFIDAAALEWVVPAQARIDGASIPRILWAVVGGPYEGKYRNASVVHDWYCDTRTRPWEAVHRMFHEAMLASGVEPTQAKIMYLAVRYGGPRWSAATIDNNTLAGKPWSAPMLATPRELKAGPAGLGMADAPAMWKRDVTDTAEFDALAAQVAAKDLSIEEIDRLADNRPATIVTRTAGY